MQVIRRDDGYYYIREDLLETKLYEDESDTGYLLVKDVDCVVVLAISSFVTSEDTGGGYQYEGPGEKISEGKISPGYNRCDYEFYLVARLPLIQVTSNSF